MSHVRGARLTHRDKGSEKFIFGHLRFDILSTHVLFQTVLGVGSKDLVKLTQKKTNNIILVYIKGEILGQNIQTHEKIKKDADTVSSSVTSTASCRELTADN